MKLKTNVMNTAAPSPCLSSKASAGRRVATFVATDGGDVAVGIEIWLMGMGESG